MKDLIDGALGFIDIADFVILTDEQPLDPNILKKDAIIFCQTSREERVFDYLRFSNNSYILITHMSDYYVDWLRYSTKPKCIKKWYTTIKAYDHPDIIQIPIGFGVHWTGPLPQCNEVWRQWFFDNCERLAEVEKDIESIYCNYSLEATPSRKLVLDKLKQNNNKLYVEPNATKLEFPAYCEEMAKFKFCAAPPGNGIGVNKIWEAIYTGCIPISIKNLIHRDYQDELPILFVNDYTEVTPALLKDYLHYYNNHEFNFEKATLSYWTNRILQDFEKIKKINANKKKKI